MSRWLATQGIGGFLPSIKLREKANSSVLDYMDKDDPGFHNAVIRDAKIKATIGDKESRKFLEAIGIDWRR